MRNWLLSEVWNIKSPNLSVFSAEKIPRIFESPNDPRRRLDIIALKSNSYKAVFSWGDLLIFITSDAVKNQLDLVIVTLLLIFW